MHFTQFQKIIQQNRPIIVEFWAPWCAPCKQMAPILEDISKEYKGKVELVKINADDSGELSRKLKVFSIPTLLVYQNSQITGRFVGVVGFKQLQTIFKSAENNIIPMPKKMGNVKRILSLTTSFGVFFIAIISGFSPILLLISAIILFYAIHDRCPIWQAFMGWIRKKTKTDS